MKISIGHNKSKAVIIERRDFSFVVGFHQPISFVNNVFSQAVRRLSDNINRITLSDSGSGVVLSSPNFIKTNHIRRIRRYDHGINKIRIEHHVGINRQLPGTVILNIPFPCCLSLTSQECYCYKEDGYKIKR